MLTGDQLTSTGVPPEVANSTSGLPQEVGNSTMNICAPLSPEPDHYGDIFRQLNFSSFNVLFNGSYENINREWGKEEYSKIVACSLLVLLAMVGNFMVILSVYMNKAMRTTINYYLVNLSIADVLICAWCPWTSLINKGLYHTSIHYILPSLFCKADVFYRVLCMVASVLTLSAISFDRFLAVIFPLRTRVTQHKARYLILFVWVTASVVAFPFLIYREINEVIWADFTQITCNEVFPFERVCDVDSGEWEIVHTSKQIFYSLVTIVMFLVPVLIMTVCYTMIVVKLFCTVSPGERLGGVSQQSLAKRKVVKMVLVVLCVFVLCCAPLQFLMASAIFTTGNEFPTWLREYEFWIELLAYSHAMANPFIYVTFNTNFRKCFIKIVTCNGEEINRENSNKSSFINRRFSWRRTSTLLRREPRTITLRNMGIRTSSASINSNMLNHINNGTTFINADCHNDIVEDTTFINSSRPRKTTSFSIGAKDPVMV